MNDFELLLHRKGTEQFIEKDSTTIVLIPSDEVENFGTKEFVEDDPREPQDFKFIYPGGDGIVVNSEGTTRRFDFILVGKYDAIVEIGDHWTESGQHYVVEWIAPYNDYEVKVGGSSHGDSPAHG